MEILFFVLGWNEISLEFIPKNLFYDYTIKSLNVHNNTNKHKQAESYNKK